jgi:hypothetical protein
MKPPGRSSATPLKFFYLSEGGLVNTTRRVFLLLSLFLFALQGCCTMAVSNIGVESESVRRCERVSVGADGSIAVLVNSVFHKEFPLSEGYIENSRIVMGSHEVVRKSVTSSSLRDKSTLLVPVNIVDKELDGWHMLPYLLNKNDTFLSYLPKSFQNNSTFYNSCAFNYSIDNKYEDVYLSHFFFHKNGNQSDKRTNISIWHYPSQILLIPAFIFDVATAPIQLIILGHEVGKRNQI